MIITVEKLVTWIFLTLLVWGVVATIVYGLLYCIWSLYP